MDLCHFWETQIICLYPVSQFYRICDLKCSLKHKPETTLIEGKLQKNKQNTNPKNP